jgi:hypothetical protein
MMPFSVVLYEITAAAVVAVTGVSELESTMRKNSGVGDGLPIRL